MSKKKQGYTERLSVFKDIVHPIIYVAIMEYKGRMHFIITTASN